MVTVDATFEECFREHYPRLVALGVAMSGSSDVACELAQETMIRAHHRWEEVQMYERPGAWLRRVMTNLLIDHHRSRAAERRALRRLPAFGRTAVDDGDAGWVDDWFALVAPLPPRQRLIVTLYYGEDASVDDIAALLDIAPGTVKSLLARARHRLHDLLEQAANDG